MTQAGPQRPRPGAVPTATYRLQFHKDFTFRDAEEILPYLARLGVSHVYASPYFGARAGSTHGYDIVDHNSLNPEVGNEADFDSFVSALRQHGMGQIVDFVPNHMGIGGADNSWWLDVLEYGEASPYAAYFDIDWRPARGQLRGKVLVPILGRHYGEVLQSGKLRLAFDRGAGGFSLWYFEHRLPIGPRSYPRILERVLMRLRQEAPHEALALAELIGSFRDLRGRMSTYTRRRSVRPLSERLKNELAAMIEASPAVARCLDAVLGEINGEDESGKPDALALHRLLEAQAYRVAFWRVASSEINYRRFFDINDLAGIRVEIPEVFDAIHQLVFRWIADGKVEGLRLDHIDGLFDPQQYCARLQAHAGALSGGTHYYILVEKILAPHELLPENWPVAGTTGYDFLNVLNGLFVDPDGERPLTRFYTRFSEEPTDFGEMLYECKKHVMDNALASELNVLANELNRISEMNWQTRDYTRDGLRDALREVVARMTVYRTYVTAKGAGDEDRRYIDWAVRSAKRRSGGPDLSIYDFIRSVLTTDLVRGRSSGFPRREVVRFAMKFQQYTGPVTAKGFEDTSLYRYNRLISLNDVGGDPRRFGLSPAAFHHLNQERLRRWPFSMLSTSTHDTKRGEDARARINILSEVPREWRRQVRRWARLNRSRKQSVDDAAAPTANDEYLLYQTLLGSWPAELMDLDRLDAEVLGIYRARIEDYMTKAIREAKTKSSWTNPDEAYEAAVSEFLHRILDPEESHFIGEFVPFAFRIARAGMVNSLAQTVLKLTVPGVPDVYQGSELWDLSLVDPDNRRPVDYGLRAALLSRFEADDPAGYLRDLLMQGADGRAKLYVIWKLLTLRRHRPTLFLDGSYTALLSTGTHADRVCSFLRQGDGVSLIAIAPRLSAGLSADGILPVWEDTAIACPPDTKDTDFRDLFSRRPVAPQYGGTGEPMLSLAPILADFPVAVLLSFDNR